MKFARTALTAALALAAIAPSFADNCQPKSPIVTVARVEAAPFQLKQAGTQKLSDTVSRSLYRGETVLTVTPAKDPAYTIPVRVELATVTTLNAAGDGYTDGMLTLVNTAKREAISGMLVAINQDNGDLTGVLEGRMAGYGSAPSRLRAVFHGVFVQDSAGSYTLVNVDSRGVLITMTPPSGTH